MEEQITKTNSMCTTQNMVVSRVPISHFAETENSYLASFELPGIKKEDIFLDFKEGVLSLSAKASEETTFGSSKSYKSFSYEQKVSLPKNSDIANIKANYRNGMLRIEIPKRFVEPQKIDID